MLKLRSTIQQLDEHVYLEINQNFIETGATKFLTLFASYREGKDDEQIENKLTINSSAFYTLKSRLYSKIQEFLAIHSSSSKIEVLKGVANIPNLIFNQPKETALIVLLGLEKDLKRYDMPYELCYVYNALKKLHSFSPKYYTYSQLYNKQLAFMTAIDKAEDLLVNFSKQLGSFLLSQDASKIDLLSLMKTEMNNVSRIYSSHHIKVYKAIIDASSLLFLPESKANIDEDPIEDILNRALDIINENPNDVAYQNLSLIIHYLFFEYYHQIKQHKKAKAYFEPVNEQLPTFLLSNFCCFPTKFLLTKVERYVIEGKEGELHNENKLLESSFNQDPEDEANFINYYLYLAIGSFYSKKYSEAISSLNNIINTVTFKHFPHAEIEVKLFACLVFCFANKYEQAETIVKSLSRKLSENYESTEYQNAQIILKIIKYQLSSENKNFGKNIEELKEKFVIYNVLPRKILGFLALNDEFIKQLSKKVK